jgi:hypothetical protein
MDNKTTTTTRDDILDKIHHGLSLYSNIYISKDKTTQIIDSNGRLCEMEYDQTCIYCEKELEPFRRFLIVQNHCVCYHCFQGIVREYMFRLFMILRCHLVVSDVIESLLKAYRRLITSKQEVIYHCAASVRVHTSGRIGGILVSHEEDLYYCDYNIVPIYDHKCTHIT